MNRIRRCVLAIVMLLSVLGGCGGGGSDQGGAGLEHALRVSGGGGIEGTGAAIMRLSATAEPACGFDAVHVTIDRVRVNRSAAAEENDAGWSEVSVTPPRRVELVALARGTLEPLGETTLPAGRYSQMRLVLAPNTATDPLANSVTPAGGLETALTVPGAQQGGLKVSVSLDMPAGQLSHFALDFDACKSVVRRGNSGQYNLKPAISVIPVASGNGQRVTGYVDPTIAAGSTVVSVQQGGVPVKATAPDASGRFVLYPVPVGTYDLVISARGRAAAVMTGLPVAANVAAMVNGQGQPISPPTSIARSVMGSVNPSSATVRALQALGAGPAVEVMWAPVDAGSGAFALLLPEGPPVRAIYSATSGGPTFLPDPTAASRFKVEARANNTTSSLAIDTAAPVPLLTFAFQ